MNKIMKKLSLGLLVLGMMAASKAKAFASDYYSSTWSAVFIAYSSTLTTTLVSNTTSAYGLAGGLSPSGTFDLTRVFISSGFNNGAYFVCVDSLPLTAVTGGSPAYLSNFGSFDASQYLFPPLVIQASTATVPGTAGSFIGGQNYGAVLDLRDYGGGGVTWKKGLSCYIIKPASDVTPYVWMLQTQETPSAVNRRER